MKLKYTDKPSYPEVEVFGKTISGSVFGTVDRRPVGRRLLTTEEGFVSGGAHADKVIVDGDGTVVQTVKKVDEVEVVVQLVDGSKSAASFKFFDCYTAPNTENEGVLDVFTTNGEQLERIEMCAERMCLMAPGNDGQYSIVAKGDGKRVFLRAFSKNVVDGGKLRD